MLRKCPKSVPQNQLQDTVCTIFTKLNWSNDKTNIEDCHLGKGNKFVLVKFPKRKDCRQVMSIKNDLKKI